MVAVMFGFTWLTRPSNEEIEAQRAKQEQAAAEALRQAQAENEVISFAQSDSAALASAVFESGNSAGNGSYSFSNDNLRLSVDSVAGLSGVYADEAGEINILDLMANRANVTSGRARNAAKAIKAVIANAAKYEGFSRYLSGENKDIILENDLVKVTVASRGAMVSQVELKKYKTEVGPEPETIKLFKDDTDGYGFKFNTADQRIDTRDFYFTPTMEGDSAVLLSMEPVPGATWGIRYVLAPDGYTVRMDIVQNGMEKILPPNTASMEFDWHQKMGRNERGRTFEERNSAIFYKYIGESVDDLNANDDDEESLNGRLRWVAFKNQFFSSVIIARDAFTSAELSSKDLKKTDYLKDMTMKATLPYTIGNGTAEQVHRQLRHNHPAAHAIHKAHHIPVHIQELPQPGQDARSRSRNQGNQRKISRSGRRHEAPAGDHGSLQPGRGESFQRLPPHAVPDAGAHRDVLVLPLGD